MSSPGRPKTDYRRAPHEGTPVNALLRRGAGLVAMTLPLCTWAQPTLNLHGTRLPSVCAPASWKVLATELARQPQPDALLGFARALLCEPQAQALPTLARHAPPRLTVHAQGTGEKPERLRQSREDALPPREGQAWDVSVQVDGAGAVGMSYMEDEACLRSVTLKRAHGQWRVSSVGHACD